VGAANFRYPAMTSYAQAGLPHARIESEVTYEFLRRAEAPHLTDGGDEANRDDDIDASDRQKPPKPRIVKCGLRERPIDHGEIFGMPINLAQPLLDRAQLVLRQGLLREPR
jgi:hypothetical protein